MAGNIHEWTSSKSEPYPYRADDGREDVDYYSDRVTRGGTHDPPADVLIATGRGEPVSRNPIAGHHSIGFRCARSIERLALNKIKP
jgi:formylglycine-generating enzyme required for sulfatase activity